MRTIKVKSNSRKDLNFSELRKVIIISLAAEICFLIFIPLTYKFVNLCMHNWEVFFIEIPVGTVHMATWRKLELPNDYAFLSDNKRKTLEWD